MHAGLYKQLAELQGLLQEFRSDPTGNFSLKEPIVTTLSTSGLQKDCPFVMRGASEVHELTAENVAEVPQAEFEDYCSKLYGYAFLRGFVWREVLCAASSHLSAQPSTQYLNQLGFHKAACELQVSARGQQQVVQ